MREAEQQSWHKSCWLAAGGDGAYCGCRGSDSRNPYEHHHIQPQISRVSRTYVKHRELNVEVASSHSFFIIAYTEYVVYLSISTASFHSYSSGPVHPPNHSQTSSASCKHASLTWYKAEDQLPPKCKVQNRDAKCNQTNQRYANAECPLRLRVSFLYIYQLSSYARCFKYATRKFAKTFRSLEVVIERIMSEPSKPIDGKNDCCKCSMKSIPVLL